MIAALSFVFVPKAGARTLTRRASGHFSFNQPVGIPGMVLDPGTYVFKLLDTGSRNIVQVLNSDQDQCSVRLSQFRKLAIDKRSDKVTVTFRESSWLACAY